MNFERTSRKRHINWKSIKHEQVDIKLDTIYLRLYNAITINKMWEILYVKYQIIQLWIKLLILVSTFFFHI